MNNISTLSIPMKKARVILIILLMITSILSCSFSSKQYKTVKSLFTPSNNLKETIEYKQSLWTATIANQDIEFLPVKLKQGLRFSSQRGVEIDFDLMDFNVVAVRGWEILTNDIVIEFIDSDPSTENFIKRHSSNHNVQHDVICSRYRQQSTADDNLLYSRQCRNKSWQYEDKLILNSNNEIYHIETSIDPNSEPLILIWNRFNQQ